MESYRIEEHLRPIYTRHPECRRRPLIGITANHELTDATLRDKYYELVAEAGGTPVIIPPVPDADIIMSTLQSIDALLLTGGADINPLWSGEQPLPSLGHVNGRRDLAELLTVRLAYNRQIPMLGICRGIQTLATALGGHVAQDIASATGVLKHSQDADRDVTTHTVTLTDGSVLASIFGGYGRQIAVNSFHHQAVDACGPQLRVTATAPDGTIEGVESACHKPVLGVQWHPEWLGADGLPLFRWLVDEAALFARAKAFHRSHVTLDSHCDTPMFFPKGIDFGTRDSHILVDLHKMDDGLQAAVTMVAYLEQPKDGKTFSQIAPLPVSGPRAYADLIFDKIQAIADAHPQHLALARTPSELEANRLAGKHTIMLGIENGQAIEHSIDNLRHFADRGIVYMTLCHNGDNDICDSARGTATWGGVSPFGTEVIRAMNELGMMVDLSHGAEKSFYDAVEMSSQPIVCSHSSCRALCDHPRNLTDDQMRLLARTGGVMQVTAYHGFLRLDGEASILDFLAHLDHAVSVIGVEHVGIGTDFDGDGGVPGLADSSELLNLTRHLMRRRYNDHDLQLIWGGNWLRLMKQVQENRL